jgi:hypothetical protein
MAEEKNYLHISGNSVTLPVWIFIALSGALMALLTYNFNMFSKRLDEIQTTQSEIKESIFDLKYQYQNLELRVIYLERLDDERNNRPPSKKKPNLFQKNTMVVR